MSRLGGFPGRDEKGMYEINFTYAFFKSKYIKRVAIEFSEGMS